MFFQDSHASTDDASTILSSPNVLEASFASLLSREVRYHSQMRTFNMGRIACFNCGGIHSTVCEFPTYFKRCYRCLVISLDGSGHTTPCAPINTISALRTDIFARSPLPLFKLRLNKNESSMHYLNMDVGRFEEVTGGRMLLSSATDGYLSFNETDNYIIMSYGATCFKRMSFVVALLDDRGYWRLRYRAVISKTHGLLLFKLRSTMQMENGLFTLPMECRLNTTVVLGLKPVANTATMQFRIFANQDGIMDSRIFSGYTSVATWTAGPGHDRDDYGIDDEIDGETTKEKRYFNERLQEQVPPALATFHSQRFAQN